MREIKPINNRGSIQLKFTFRGHRYSFNPIAGASFNNHQDYLLVQAIATKITNDIRADHFDSTLERYRPSREPQKPKNIKTLLNLWDDYVNTLPITPNVTHGHYKWTRLMIAKANPGLLETDWLNKFDYAHKTFKERLTLIRACCAWGVKQGHIKVNPWESIKPPKKIPQSLKPFTKEEIAKILDGFEYLYPHYVPFVSFLFATGVRIAEAIGLCWHHIDFERNLITISESLPKDPCGNGYARKRKGTKTGNIRHLGLNKTLKSLLEPLKGEPEALVFQTVTGKAIDGDNFRDRLWTHTLYMVDVPYRKPYNIRHTMASHGIDQGIPLTGLAYLMGHSDMTMIIKTYGHMVNRPDLPDIL